MVRGRLFFSKIIAQCWSGSTEARSKPRVILMSRVKGMRCSRSLCECISSTLRRRPCRGTKTVLAGSSTILREAPRRIGIWQSPRLEVWYADVYHGIDLIYHCDQSQLEFDFQIAPHAKPSKSTCDSKALVIYIWTTTATLSSRALMAHYGCDIRWRIKRITTVALLQWQPHSKS